MIGKGIIQICSSYNNRSYVEGVLFANSFPGVTIGRWNQIATSS